MGRPKGCAKTGGRVAGKSLDKGERIKINSQMAGSILAVFERLGGEDFLYRWAKENQTAYVTNCLARLMPPMPKDDPDIQINQQFNSGMSDFESARRIAFALAKAAHEQEQLPPVMEAVRVTASRDPEPEPEMSPQEACRWVAPDQPNPSPHQDDLELDPARQRWIEELPLTDEQRADNQLVRQTREGSLETYQGSAREQFDAPHRPEPPRKLSAGEKCRAVMSRRGRDLL